LVETPPLSLLKWVPSPFHYVDPHNGGEGERGGGEEPN